MLLLRRQHRAYLGLRTSCGHVCASGCALQTAKGTEKVVLALRPRVQAAPRHHILRRVADRVQDRTHTIAVDKPSDVPRTSHQLHLARCPHQLRHRLATRQMRLRQSD